ncbi:MAG: LamG domain-containing protein [Akkermansia sp.]
MKKHLLLAALAAALLPNARAFNDTIWTFDETLASVSSEGLHDSTGTYTGSGDVSYTDSGLTSGMKVGDYTLTQDLGKAIVLDGSAYVQLSDSNWSSITSTTSYTLMAWVKATGTSGTGSIFGTGKDNSTGIKFDLRDYNTPQLTQKYVGLNYYNSKPITLNQWYNVAITVDGSTNAVTYYLNGKCLGTDTKDSRFNAAQGAYAAIGSGSYDGQDLFSGQIAELQVLSGTLTQTQILKAAHLTPEPTTATLSLLALAGLAARRRR